MIWNLNLIAHTQKQLNRNSFHLLYSMVSYPKMMEILQRQVVQVKATVMMLLATAREVGR